MLWLGSSKDESLFGYSFDYPPTDYYNELVDGFISGHLYMKVQPHPDLFSPDAEVRRRAPTLLDAGFYQGHFYLYYGVTPATLTFLPYTWLTGHHLSPNLVTLLFVAVGSIYAIGVLRAIIRDHSIRLPTATSIGLMLLLAFASGTPELLLRSMFYEVPVAAGYACVMAACYHLYRTLYEKTRIWRHLALASLWLGLAVGCRPNYVLLVPLLFVAALIVNRRNAAGRLLCPRWPGLFAAALLPAAAIGAGLAAYNYARFGSVFEFGFKYGQNEFFSTQDRLISPAFIWTNLKWYYLTPPSLSPYFPYIFPINGSFLPKGYHGSEAMHGEMAVAVLATFVGLSALIIWRRDRNASVGQRSHYFGMLAWIVLSSFAFMALLGIRANRYMVDFHAALVLIVALTAGLLATRLGRWWRSVLLGFVLVATSFNVLVALQQFDEFRNRRPRTFRALAGLGNRPSAWATRLGLLHYGPLKLRISFRSETESTIQPLAAIGTPGYSDTLCVIQHPGRRIQFMVDHSGYGGPKTELMPIEIGRVYEVTFDMGSLYPPLQHPFFANYDTEAARMRKTNTLVRLDGRIVLHTQMQAYDAPPWTLQIGRDHITNHGYKTEFTGSILSVERLPVEPIQHDPSFDHGLWRLKCTLPLNQPGTTHPLLASGITGDGNLLFLKIDSGGRMQFGLDQWGVGATFSDPMAPKSQPTHIIECFIGPSAVRHGNNGTGTSDSTLLQTSAHTIRVWLDGQLAWSSRVTHHLNSYDHIEVGTNTAGFSSTPERFSGEITSVPFSEAEAHDFLSRNLAAGQPPSPQK